MRILAQLRTMAWGMLFQSRHATNAATPQWCVRGRPHLGGPLTERRRRFQFTWCRRAHSRPVVESAVADDRGAPSGRPAGNGSSGPSASPAREQENQITGHWAVQSLSEAEATALGIEIRTHSVKAALVDVKTGAFLRAGVRQRLDRCDPDSLRRALRRITKEFAWGGPVGCSITIAVARSLGVENVDFTTMGSEVSAILNTFLPGNPVVTIVHTEAAGYAELSFAPQHIQRGQLVLVCTIGRNLGAVLYNDGHRMRNTGLSRIRGPFRDEFSALEARFKNQWRQIKGTDSFIPPLRSTLPLPNDGSGAKDEETSDGWAEFVTLVDSYLIQLADFVKPDKIILMPTGAFTASPLVESMIPKLSVSERATCKPEVLAGDSAIGAMVRGAAVGALVELKTQEAVVALRQAIGIGQSTDVVELQNLRTEQLRAAFDSFDMDGDGVVSKEQLKNFLQNLVTSLSPDVMENKLGRMRTSASGEVTFNDFRSWWERMITKGPVTIITSESEWESILVDPFPERGAEGKDALIVLQVGFSFCRPCKRFAPKYEQYAQTYSHVRFVRINGNENQDTIAFCKDKLHVRKTPTFFVFQKEKQVNSWTGANEEIFAGKLKLAAGDPVETTEATSAVG